jgi:hypothetical protein
MEYTREWSVKNECSVKEQEIDVFKEVTLKRTPTILLLYYTYYIFPPVALQPNFGLGRLHETFLFISVTRSRPVSTTLWTGDQLVARTLLTAPGDCDDDDGEVGGMNGFGRGNRSTRRKAAPMPLCPHKSHLPDPGANPGRRDGKRATNRFSYGAAYTYYIEQLYPIRNLALYGRVLFY